MAIQLFTYAKETSYSFSEPAKKVKIHGQIQDEAINVAEKTNDAAHTLVFAMIVAILIGNVVSFSWSASILLGIGIFSFIEIASAR
jgi:hypothetical protein